MADEYFPNARDLDGNSVSPHNSIFPILADLGQGHTRLTGTGFFITRLGHFVTAKHVILAALDANTGQQMCGLHALHFVVGFQALVRNITKVSVHNTSDVALGKMDYYMIDATGEPLMNSVPRLTTEVPAIGSHVCTFAYPESDWDFIKGTPAAFHAKYYTGRMQEHSELPRDSSLVAWPHYRTSISLSGGASGGPAFDEKGRVFGVNCVGGIEGLSYMARATEILDLSVPEFPGDREYTVFDLAKAGIILFDPPPSTGLSS